MKAERAALLLLASEAVARSVRALELHARTSPSVRAIATIAAAAGTKVVALGEVCVGVWLA